MAPEKSIGTEAQSFFVFHHTLQRGEILRRLFVGGGLERGAPRCLGHFPVPRGTILGDDIGFFPAESLELHARAARPAVGVDAENIDRGIVLHDLTHLVLVGPGDDGHNRMIRVLLLDDLGQLLEFFPDPRRLREAGKNFRFVAESPDEQIRMVFVAAHRLADLLALLLHHLRVKVGKSVALVHDPKAGAEGEAEFLNLGQIRLSRGIGLLQFLNAPITHRIGPHFFGQSEGSGTADPEDEVGFPVAAQFPAFIRGLSHFDL